MRRLPPLPVFESGAIPICSAEKAGRFLPADLRGRKTVLDRRLDGRDYIAGDYSIADMACWPWVVTCKGQKVDPEMFPNVRRRYKAL